MNNQKYILRDYQEETVQICLDYLSSSNNNPVMVAAPVAAGKSIIIGSVAIRSNRKVLILQPSKELLDQNRFRAESFGFKVATYSASFKMKEMGVLTFATLGSIKGIASKFREEGIDTVLIDECHYNYPPDEGSMFMTFIKELKPKKVIGFSATLFRLKQFTDPLSGLGYSQLNMLNRMRPSYFKEVLHIVQIKEMIDRGFWCPLLYDPWVFHSDMLQVNSTGAEYKESSIAAAVKHHNTNNAIIKYLWAIAPYRKHILCFLDSVKSCYTMRDYLNRKAGKHICEVVEANTKKRKDIVSAFKNGNLRVVLNYSTLGTGFDFPELDCVINGRPTFSLANYYQIIGRVLRIHPGKENALYVDCCGNTSRFGKVEGLYYENYPGYGWGLFNGEQLLTNVPMGTTTLKHELIGNNGRPVQPKIKLPGTVNHDYDHERVTFGQFKGLELCKVPLWFVKYVVTEFDKTENTKMFFEYYKL